MHFTKLSLAFLGLAAFASAVPHQLEAGNVERALTWTPRSLQARGDSNSKNQDSGNGNKNKKNKDSITIIDTTIVKLDEKSKNAEVELIVKVQEEVRRTNEKKKDKDNLRKNHFRNKNKDVNTVIIVITQIIDVRDSKNENKRYMRHQLRADNKQKEDVTIQVTEIKAITISNDNKGGNGKGKSKDNGKESRTTDAGEDKSGKAIAATAASDAAAAAIQTVDPNAPFAANNQTVILPSGAPAPSAAQVVGDPAAILEDGFNGAIVQSVGS